MDYSAFYNSPRLVAATQNNYTGVFLISFEQWHNFSELSRDAVFEELLNYIDKNKSNISFVFHVLPEFGEADKLARALNGHANIEQLQLSKPRLKEAKEYVTNEMEKTKIYFTDGAKEQLEFLIETKVNTESQAYLGYETLKRFTEDLVYEVACICEADSAGSRKIDSKRADYFMVKPNNSGDRFFYSYYLYFDGRKVPAEKSECEKILWEYMAQRLKETKLSYFDNGGSSKKAALPHKFSMNGIIETLDFIIPKEKQCRSKDFVLIKIIFGILELYLDKDTDITGLLYSLCEASSELNPNIGFPSEKLYWRLKELQLENEDADMSLSMLIHDHNYGMLIKKLTNETFDNEKIEQSVENNSSVKNITYDPWKSEYERDHIDGNGGMIGTFSVYADGFKTSPVSLEEGIFLGDQIIPRVNFLYETGIVTYDARTRMHYITCEHDITCEQKLQIIKDFDIDEDMVSVIKQGLPRTKRRRKTGLEQRESTCAAG